MEIVSQTEVKIHHNRCLKRKEQKRRSITFYPFLYFYTNKWTFASLKIETYLWISMVLCMFFLQYTSWVFSLISLFYCTIIFRIFDFCSNYPQGVVFSYRDGQIYKIFLFVWFYQCNSEFPVFLNVFF